MNKAEREQERRKEIMDKGQRVLSRTADFDENTWTFNAIGNDFVFGAGMFIVLPVEKFEEQQLRIEELERWKSKILKCECERIDPENYSLKVPDNLMIFQNGFLDKPQTKRNEY